MLNVQYGWPITSVSKRSLDLYLMSFPKSSVYFKMAIKLMQQLYITALISNIMWNFCEARNFILNVTDWVREFF